MLKKPDTYISQRILPINEAKNQMLSGHLDFALSFVPPGDDRFEWHSYGAAGMSVMLSDRHPLYQERQIDLRALKEDRFITNNSNTDLNTIFQTAFQEAGFAPKIIFGGDEPRLISSLVKENMGVFMIPDVVNRIKARDRNPFGERQGYRFIPLSFPKCNIVFGLCSRKDQKMKQKAEGFYEFLRLNLADLLSDRYVTL